MESVEMMEIGTHGISPVRISFSLSHVKAVGEAYHQLMVLIAVSLVMKKGILENQSVLEMELLMRIVVG